MLTLFVVVYGISQRPTLQTAVGADLAQCIAFLGIAVFAFYYNIISLHAFIWTLYLCSVYQFRPKNDLKFEMLVYV
jgi:hypothetical protein